MITKDSIGQEHGHFLPVTPVPTPTVEQSLAFALTDLAKCKARLHRHQNIFAECLMYLQMNECERAKELLRKGWADL